MKTLRSRAILVLMVLTLGAVACGDADESPTSPSPGPPAPAPSPTPTPTPTTASLTGTVSNSAGSRIAGATVRALDGPNAGQTAMTNASGEFTFESLAIANTNFEATQGGYNPVRAGAHVDGNATLNFVFNRAALEGVVRDSDGAPVGGALVKLLDGAMAGASVVAGGGGAYRFSSLPVANVNVVASAPEHFDDSRGTFVNGTNRLDFVLVRMPEDEGGGEEPPVEGGDGITIIASVVGATEWRFEAVSSETFVFYNWTFGDGSGAGMTDETEQHLYTRTGTFTVTVEGVRANGSVVTGSIEIEVRN